MMKFELKTVVFCDNDGDVTVEFLTKDKIDERLQSKYYGEKGYDFMLVKGRVGMKKILDKEKRKSGDLTGSGILWVF